VAPQHDLGFPQRPLPFAGIVVQEYDHQQRKLVGPMTKILEKKNILCEGPNLYRQGGWYYLIWPKAAPAGTTASHGAGQKKSPGHTSLIPGGRAHSRDDPTLTLQKAGHGEIVQTQTANGILPIWRAGRWRPALHEFGFARPVRLGGRPRRPSLYAGPGNVPPESGVARRLAAARDRRNQTAGGVPAPQKLPPHPWPAMPERMILIRKTRRALEFAPCAGG